MRDQALLLMAKLRKQKVAEAKKMKRLFSQSNNNNQ
jgi:hypothetical protein